MYGIIFFLLPYPGQKFSNYYLSTISAFLSITHGVVVLSFGGASVRHTGGHDLSPTVGRSEKNKKNFSRQHASSRRYLDGSVGQNLRDRFFSSEVPSYLRIFFLSFLYLKNYYKLLY